jgi:hypothetical protein
MTSGIFFHLGFPEQITSVQKHLTTLQCPQKPLELGNMVQGTPWPSQTLTAPLSFSEWLVPFFVNLFLTWMSDTVKGLSVAGQNSLT